jgi:hypothetical protein
MGSGVSKPPRVEFNEDRKKKVAKIPLNIALVAIVKIQVRFRMRVARRKFEEVRRRVTEERRLAELARKLKIPERDETTPMKTSAASSLCNDSSEVNARNRFIRKTAHEQHVKFTEANLLVASLNRTVEIDPALSLEKYSLADEANRVIYPLVGYVAKSRCNITGRKVFFNICHHETIATMVCAPVREVADTAAAELYRDLSHSRQPSFTLSGRPFTANSTSMFNTSSAGFGAAGENNGEVVLVADVVLPSAEFEECFSYSEDEGLVPISTAVRTEMVRQAVKFWNITHNDDISDGCTFPKIKRGYFGDMLPMLLDVKSKTVTHLPSALRACAALSAGNPTITSSTLSTTFGQVRESGALVSLQRGGKETGRFRLPYAAQVCTWADVTAVGTRVAVVETAVPAEHAPVASLAMVEPTQARKCLTKHPLIFTCRTLPPGVVEYVLPAPAPVVRIPLFGPAYAAQLLTAQQQAAGSEPEGSGEKANSVLGSAPKAGITPVSPAIATAGFTPHMPAGAKPGRSLTMSAAGTQSGAAGHRHLSGPVGTAWTKAAATAVNAVNAAPAVATPVSGSSATATVGATAFAGTGAVTRASIAVLREPAEFTAAANACLDADLLKSEPNECNTTLPVYLVLSAGVLYLFNRDPLRSCYFPRNPTRPAPIETDPKTGAPTAEAKAEPVASKDDLLPLVAYGRIMLTEDCVFMSSDTVEGARTWSIHIRPLDGGRASTEDTVALLYTQLHEVFRSVGGVTLTLRSYSEFRTWKAHLRAHIQLGTMVRKRILTEYVKSVAQTVLNSHALSDVPGTKSGEVVLLQGRLKRFIQVENGLLYMYEEKHPDEHAGRNLLSVVELTDTVTTLRNEMLKDNSSENIVSVKDARGNVVEGSGKFCTLLLQ